MRSARLLIFVTLVPLLLAAQSLQDFEKRITEFTLPNGLHFIVFERHAAWPDKPFEGKKTSAPSFSSEPYWQEGAGGLLLVAAESRDKVALTLGNGATPSVNCCSLTRAVSCSGLSSQIVASPTPA